MSEPDDYLKKKLETQNNGGDGNPPRPTAVGTNDSGYDGDRALPDIASLKSFKGVIGSLFVGHDGELRANDLPADFIDSQSLGAWALAVYMNTSHVVKKIGQNKCHQIISKSSMGYSLIADCHAGLIVTITESDNTDNLIPLMRGVTQLLPGRSKT